MKTAYMLLAEYESSDIPLNLIAEKYFGCSAKCTNQMARHNEFPFPVFRGGNPKSHWLVNVVDLAQYLDEIKAKAREKHRLLYNPSI